MIFWQKGKTTGLNEVPQSKFKVGKQLFIRPLGDGKSVTFPIEVYFIDEENYIITFTVTSKTLSMKQDVAIKFQKPK